MTEEAPVTPEVVAPSDSLLTTETPAALDFAAGKPEGFPDDFWDAEKKAPKTDALYTAYNQQKTRADGLRVKLSKGEFEGKAPEDIKEYTLELSDELKPLVPEDDRMLAAARQAAKDAGLPKEAFSKFMLPMIQELAKAKAEMETPLSPEEIQTIKDGEIAKLGPSGAKITSAVGAFVEQLHSGGTFSDSEAAAIRASANNVDMVRALNKLRMMAGGQDQVPTDMPIDERASKMDIESKMSAAMLAGNEAEYLKYSSLLAKTSN